MEKQEVFTTSVKCAPNVLTFGVLVVIYKKNLYESETIKSLIRCEKSNNISLYIWDNSESSYTKSNQKEFAELKKYFFDSKYYFKNKNISLAKIYNTIQDEAFTNENLNYITILDHDTQLQSNFFINLLDEIYLFDSPSLILPKVASQHNKTIISPRSRSRYFKNSISHAETEAQFKNPGIHKSENFFAVGSGISISKKLWKKRVRFDENLKFYGVDSEFCISYSKSEKNLLLSKNLIVHDNSIRENDSIKTRLWRIHNRLLYQYYCSKKDGQSKPGKLRLLFLEKYLKLMIYEFYLSIKKIN